MSFIPVPSTVQPLPTRDARKLRIQQELEKIPIKDGLYLPTNPTCEVTPFASLQRHAHVYLASRL